MQNYKHRMKSAAVWIETQSLESPEAQPLPASLSLPKEDKINSDI